MKTFWRVTFTGPRVGNNASRLIWGDNIALVRANFDKLVHAATVTGEGDWYRAKWVSASNTGKTTLMPNYR